MTDALCALAVGVAVGVVLAAAFRLHQRDAELLRVLAELRDARDAVAQRDATIAQMQRREAFAAANLVQLSGALQQAAAERGAAHVASVPPAVKIWLN